MTEIELLQKAIRQIEATTDAAPKLSADVVAWLQRDIRDSDAYGDPVFEAEYPDTAAFWQEFNFAGVLPDYGSIAGRLFTNRLLTTAHQRISKLLTDAGLSTVERRLKAKAFQLTMKRDLFDRAFAAIQAEARHMSTGTPAPAAPAKPTGVKWNLEDE